MFTADTKFITGSGKHIYFHEIPQRISDYLSDGYEYNINIGTDSQTNSLVKFVTAIGVHKIGKGGIFFYRQLTTDKIHTLRDRIYAETTMSINCATELLEMFLSKDELIDITIHCDIGTKGKTKELIKGIVGYVANSGFDCLIKPESPLASCIADRFSK